MSHFKIFYYKEGDTLLIISGEKNASGKGCHFKAMDFSMEQGMLNISQGKVAHILSQQLMIGIH